MKTIFNLTISISTTTIENQLVNDGQIGTLWICLSTYDQSDKRMCASPQMQTHISCAFDYIPL